MRTSPASTFIAIYRGHTASDARLVALSADPILVATVVAQLLRERDPGASGDAVIGAIDRARRRGLRAIANELADPAGPDTGR